MLHRSHHHYFQCAGILREEYRRVSPIFSILNLYYFDEYLSFMSVSFSVIGILLGLGITVGSYLKGAISKQFTVNQAETLIDAQSLI